MTVEQCVIEVSMFEMLCCIDVVGFVFVFKEKTAYEMRISDWSSDVCSSDLLGGAALGGAWAPRPEPASGRGVERRRELSVEIHRAGHDLGVGDGDELGRTSCRERLCPYV